MKRLILFAIVALVAVALAAPAAMAAKGGKTKTWEITVENLTTGQPFSPPLAVVHKNKVDVFERGTIASHGVAAIAEDANNSVLMSALPKLRGVKSVATVAAAPIGPGQTATFMVKTKGKYRQLTLLSMLVNTNDTFWGVDSYRLRGQKRTLMKRAYDAGSEMNNESAAFIPGPVGGNPFVRDPEGDLIRLSPGVQGGADLMLGTHDWNVNRPVAKITIKRK